MARLALLALATIAALLISAPAVGQLPQGVSGTSEARQTVFFTGVQPNTAYSVVFYAYHYPGDEHPYALSYSGYSSNAFGQFKASVPLEYLSQHYEGGEGSVYSVRACLLEPPSFAELACTPYAYVGYVPSSLWNYHG